MSNATQQLVGGAVFLCLGLLLWFWLIPVWVEPDPDLRLPVSLAPQVVATGFCLCGIAALFSGALAPKRDAAGAEGFAPGEFRGFALMLLLLLGATVGFQYLHFLIVAPVLVAASMWMFAPVKPVSLILTSTLGPALIWGVGTHLLGRVLP